MSEPLQTHSQDLSDDVPPGPPRAITPAASRRAWHEGRVRFWWLCAIVVGAVTLVYVAMQTSEWWHDVSLFRNGVKVDARIDEANYSKIRRAWPRRAEPPPFVKLSFDLPDKTRQEVTGAFKNLDGPPVSVGDSVSIRYDPSKPTRWTDRLEPEPLAGELRMVWGLVPMTLILIFIAWLRRAGVLRIWRDEPAAEATIVNSRHSPTAPRSRVLSYALIEGDRRICQTLYPVGAGVPENGETIWVVCPPNAPQSGIVAKLYQ